jgi:hypothetical protein
MKKNCKTPPKPKPFKTGGPVKKPAQGGGNGNGPPPEGRTMRW